MTKLYCYIVSTMKSEEGAETVEYALVVGLFAIAAITTLAVLGDNIALFFTKISTAITGIVVP